MKRTCKQCGERLLMRRSDARFCSTRCRVAAHRALPAFPVELTAVRRWVRRDRKRPITMSGAPASSTDSSTWSTYADAMRSSAGDGFGVMLGDGLACWDLDHCLKGDVLAPWAADVLASIDSPLWVERSMSGTGLHVFINAAEGLGRRRGGVEFYSRARFIAVTEDRFTSPVA